MKKILPVFATGVLVIAALSSCGGSESISQATSVPPPPAEGLRIDTYYGDEIEATSYDSNTLPFVVRYNEEKYELKVDGKTAKDNLGFYNLGTYSLEIKSLDSGEVDTVTVDIKDPAKKNHYDILANLATLPPLYSSLLTANNTNEKYIWFERIGTFDIDWLKENPLYTVSEHLKENSTEAAIAFPYEVMEEIRQYIAGVLKKDPDAYFNLYVDDARHWVEYVTVAKLGLTENRYSVNLVSDGTATYNEWIMQREVFTSAEVFNQKIEERTKLLDDYRSNLHSGDNSEKDIYVGDMANGETTVRKDLILPSSHWDNVRMVCQYPEVMSYADPDLNALLKQGNFYKVLPTELFEDLTTEQQDSFLEMVKLDKDYFDQNYFNATNGKPYLVITGTALAETLKNYLQYVIDNYGSDYNLLFKPHPRHIPNSGTVVTSDWIEGNNIKILPGSMPMEVITFVYPDLYLGGYSSSLYMTSTKHTLFFFAESKENLADPMKTLFDELFPSETIFITKAMAGIEE